MTGHYAFFDPDPMDGGFVVTFPDFEYGVTQGQDLAEATEMATDLLACLIQDRIDEGTDLPQAKTRRGRHYRLIVLPPLQAAKAGLYALFRSSGIRKSELARRLGIPKSNIDRLFDLRHASRLDQIDAAFRALGKRLGVVVEDAA
jgi:antitoxin HicB